MKRDNLYQKRLESTDKGESIICGLRWIAKMEYDISREIWEGIYIITTNTMMLWQPLDTKSNNHTSK